MSLINDALKRANQAQKQNTSDRPKLTPLQPVESLKPGFDWSAYLLPALLVIVLAAGGAFLWSWAGSRRQAPSTTVTSTVAPASKVVPIAEAPRPAVESPVSKASAPTPAPPVVAAGRPPVKISTNIVVRPSPPQIKPPEAVAVPTVAATAPEPIPVVAPSAAVPVAVSPESRPAASTPPVAAPAAEPVKPVPSQPAPVVATTANSATATAAPPLKPEFPQLKVQGIMFRRTNPSAFINGKPCYVGDTIQGARVTKIERLSVFIEFEGKTRELNMEP